MRGAHRRGIALVALVLATGASSAVANPVPAPEPIPIMSERELEASIRDAEYSTRSDGRTNLATLWDGRVPLLADALRSGYPDVRQQALTALGSIASPEALDVLRRAVSDSTTPLEDVVTAANSLAWAGDSASIPLIETAAGRIAARRASLGDTPEGGVMGAQLGMLRRAIEWLERPDLRRPLIIRDGHFVRYRFLLDDISAVSLIQYDPDEPIHTFAPDEYRTICDLLQDGRFVEPGLVTEDEYLVFELSDRRSIRLVRDGANFCRSGGSWERGDPGFCVASEGLARYIDEHLGRPLPPHTAGGE